MAAEGPAASSLLFSEAFSLVTDNAPFNDNLPPPRLMQYVRKFEAMHTATTGATTTTTAPAVQADLVLELKCDQWPVAVGDAFRLDIYDTSEPPDLAPYQQVLSGVKVFASPGPDGETDARRMVSLSCGGLQFIVTLAEPLVRRLVSSTQTGQRLLSLGLAWEQPERIRARRLQTPRAPPVDQLVTDMRAALGSRLLRK
jgi:hypothetical protein